MSYELTFWREKPGVSLDAQSVYKRLNNTHFVDELEQLPYNEILEALANTFTAGWQRSGPTEWSLLQGGGFSVLLTEQFFRADCYGLSGDQLNRIINVGALFGCPLYDPQVNERFLLPNSANDS